MKLAYRAASETARVMRSIMEIEMVATFQIAGLYFFYGKRHAELRIHNVRNACSIPTRASVSTHKFVNAVCDFPYTSRALQGY